MLGAAGTEPGAPCASRSSGGVSSVGVAAAGGGSGGGVGVRLGQRQHGLTRLVGLAVTPDERGERGIIAMHDLERAIEDRERIGLERLERLAPGTRAEGFADRDEERLEIVQAFRLGGG